MNRPAFGGIASESGVGRPANLADWIEDRVLPSVASLLTRQRLNAIAFVGFTLLMLGLFAGSFVKPWYNWDMSAYFAATMRHLDPSLSNEELHQRSWSLIEDFTPEREFTKLTQSGEYRQHMYADPDDFISMLPMYEVKKLYLTVGRWLTPIVGLKQAFYLQSSLALIGVGLVLLYWMSRGGFLQSAPLVAGALLSVNFFKLGLYVTPDLPAAVFLIWGCERILAKRPWFGITLILISMGYRPDMILFLFAILLSSLVYRHLLVPAAAGFAASVVLYLFLTHGVQHPGWWTHFYFSCVEIQNTLIGFHPDFSLVAYLKGVLRGGRDWIARSRLVGLACRHFIWMGTSGKVEDKTGSTEQSNVARLFVGNHRKVCSVSHARGSFLHGDTRGDGHGSGGTVEPTAVAKQIIFAHELETRSIA